MSGIGTRPPNGAGVPGDLTESKMAGAGTGELGTRVSADGRLNAIAQILAPLIAALALFVIGFLGLDPTGSRARTIELINDVKAYASESWIIFDDDALDDWMAAFRCKLAKTFPTQAEGVALNGVDCTELNDVTRQALLDWSLPPALRARHREGYGAWARQNATLDVQAVRGFAALFRVIEACKTEMTCNGRRIATATGKIFEDFLNKTCHLVRSEYISAPEMERMATFMIVAGFDYRRHSDDRLRENTFHCEFLRRVAENTSKPARRRR